MGNEYRSRLSLYHFDVGGRKLVVRASSPDSAALRASVTMGLPDTARTLAGLLSYLEHTGWRVRVTDDQGRVIGETALAK